MVIKFELTVYIMSITKQRNKNLPGCNTSGIERIPDAFMRRFRWPYVSFIDNADAWNIMKHTKLNRQEIFKSNSELS
jgi:hypothetical protein